MLTGGCLCGAVRYETGGEPFGRGFCHCRTCQQAHAAPAVAFFTVMRSDFRVSGRLKDYRSSDHAVRRFCPECGSHLLFDDSRYPDEIDIAVATLDDPAAVPPLFNIWTRSRIPWLKLDESLPSFPERSGQ